MKDYIHHPLQWVLQSLTLWTDRLTYLAQLSRDQPGRLMTERWIREWIKTAKAACEALEDMLTQVDERSWHAEYRSEWRPPEPFKPPPRSYQKHGR